MIINFIDLKDIQAKNSFGVSPSPNTASPDTASPDIISLESRQYENNALFENTINKIFKIHTESSSTVWDRRILYGELKREGSGFIICYCNDYNFNLPGENRNADIKDDNSQGKLISSSVPGISEFTAQSALLGFFIFYSVLDEMHILDIAVANAVQRKGVGSSMLDFVLKKYSSIGIKYFFLEVRVSNAGAIKLYKNFGFKVFLLRKKYYDDNGEDALCMVKEL